MKKLLPLLLPLALLACADTAEFEGRHDKELRAPGGHIFKFQRHIYGAQATNGATDDIVLVFTDENGFEYVDHMQAKNGAKKLEWLNAGDCYILPTDNDFHKEVECP